MLSKFQYVRVKTFKEASAQLGREGALALAGGTDLLGCLRDRVLEAGKLVSLRDIKPMKAIESTPDGGLRIGAMVTLAQVAEHPLVRKSYPGLAQAALAVGSPQLRNQGTLGGNLCQKPRCWYYRGDFKCLRKGGEECSAYSGENQYHCILGGELCYMVHPSDTAPALISLEATARLAGPRGQRTTPLEKFFVPPEDDPKRETILEPGELLSSVILPPPRPKQASLFRKVRGRGAWDFALASLALAVVVDGGRIGRARVVLGGAAPIPWRAEAAEEALLGRAPGAEAAEAGARAALAKVKILDKNEYKISLFHGLFQEQLAALSGQGG